MATAGSKPKLIVIVGPTASGKSGLALKIAQKYNGEIISADSWAVYRGFNIGTSKPTISQQKAVKHWLIDVTEANDGFNAPMFKGLAQAAITDIRKWGKLPILVGGTGLYIDSLLYNFGFLDDQSPAEREVLDNTDLNDLLIMAKKLKIDLTDVDIRNKRRVIRAIESGGQKPTRSKLLPNTLIIGIQPIPQRLKFNIEARVDQMLADGLQFEVEKLAEEYGWDVEPMKGIGYQQWREYFAGTQDLNQTRERIISATNQLAKRQRTWFKRNSDINWFSSSIQAYNYAKKQLLNT